MQICTSSHTTTPTSHHSVFYRPMPFLPPNEQRQSMDDSRLTGKLYLFIYLFTSVHVSEWCLVVVELLSDVGACLMYISSSISRGSSQTMTTTHFTHNATTTMVSLSPSLVHRFQLSSLTCFRTPHWSCKQRSSIATFQEKLRIREK